MDSKIISVKDAEDFLATLPGKTRSFEDRLDYVRNCLAMLGNPQDAIPAIHIAGTSGKGSTAYFSSSLLIAAGYSVGTIVSPHITNIAERSQVNGAPLPDELYVKYFNEFITLTKNNGFHFTYIEFLTVFSYWFFSRVGVDYLVVEVGLGGRLDPTNVMSRTDKVCVITSIGFDHVEILGDTLQKIATEKAGIILSDNTVLTYDQGMEVMGVLKEVSKNNSAELFVVPDVIIAPQSQLPIYQQINFNLALEAVGRRLERDKRPAVSPEAKRIAKEVRIPGRYERFIVGDRTVILDGAHNTQKITALVDSLVKDYGTNGLITVVSFGSHKIDSVKESLEQLAKVSQCLIFTQFEIEFDGSIKAIDAESLKELLRIDIDTLTISDPYEAYRMARELGSKNKADILVTGSFYLASNLRPLLLAEY